MKKEIKELLEDVRHEFAFLTGLKVCDKACPARTWSINYKKSIEQIDSLFAKYADKQAETKPTIDLGTLIYASYESEKGQECQDMVKQLRLAGYDDNYIAVAIREYWRSNTP